MLLNTVSDSEIFRGEGNGAPRGMPCYQELVAVTGADGDLVTALGTAAAENGGASFSLHTAKEAVGLGTAAAVGLKGTLRHGTNS